MESKGDPVKAEGEAAKIIEWMRRSCPDMVPIAPLLKELMFTGFSETRYGCVISAFDGEQSVSLA